ncbi:MAG: aspartate/glutamate racemase family protein [Pseudomonadota bacterium]
MQVLVINPNSTESMTRGIVAAARSAAAPDMVVDGATNTDGPPAIQGKADGLAATPGVLRLVKQAERDDYAAAIIACFDDTGLAEARNSVDIPVIGIGQAAFHAAMIFGQFSVITTVPGSVPVIEQNIQGYGLAAACAKVHASGLQVLSLESDPESARAKLRDCARMAAMQDRSNALVLGCAGMSEFGAAMTEASGLPAIDSVAAAIGLARTVIKAAA